ncbi:hypothetical protein EHQ43_01490 [Leptospira bouyouniensis]|uniref:Uncharacterized protein n=1 Tax=Leptospira bouyouniensis TaxID=2484911 RepID=A0A7I0HWT9_9LEPT|nr:hypothetical protein [Leptospira bouyouniensis]TGL09156.1 hypothetical protein EHQ43_01490 [Leptospira bouyouniensis]
MKDFKINLKLIVIIISNLVIILNCKFDNYQVKSALVSSSPNQKLLFGTMTTRDVRIPKSIGKDFQELLVFELIHKGFTVNFYNFQESFKESKKEDSKLPLNLRSAAGEFWNHNPIVEKQLIRQEIKEVSEKETFDLFLQGTISIQNNDITLERKEYNYIFLHLYSPDGNLIGMIRSTFDNKMLYESEQMREVVSRMADEFQKITSNRK